MNIVIKRCPIFPSSIHYADDLSEVLHTEFGFVASVEDGVQGEFSVFVDGIPRLQRNGETLPSVEEVEAAIQNALPAGV